MFCSVLDVATIRKQSVIVTIVFGESPFPWDENIVYAWVLELGTTLAGHWLIPITTVASCQDGNAIRHKIKETHQITGLINCACLKMGVIEHEHSLLLYTSLLNNKALSQSHCRHFILIKKACFRREAKFIKFQCLQQTSNCFEMYT